MIVTFAKGTNGIRMSKIVNEGFTYNFSDLSIFSFNVAPEDDLGTLTPYEITATDYRDVDYKIEGDNVTVCYHGFTRWPGLSKVFIYGVLGDNDSIDLKIKVIWRVKGYILKKVFFPRAQVQNFGTASNQYLAGTEANSYGFYINNPGVNQSGLELPIGSVTSNLLGVLFDKSTLQNLTIQAVDPLAHDKTTIVAGAGTSTLIYPTYSNPSTLNGSNNDNEQPYWIRYKALSGDWYDSARYYRQWTTGQSWAARGKLATGSLHYSGINNLQLYIIQNRLSSTGFVHLVEGLNELTSYIPAIDRSEVGVLWYDWWDGLYSDVLGTANDPYPFVPSHASGIELASDLRAGLSLGQSYGYKIIPYTITLIRHGSAVRKDLFQPKDVLQYDDDDLERVAELNSPTTESLAGIYINPAHPEARRLVKRELQWLVNSGMGFNGLYLDNFPYLNPASYSKQLDYAGSSYKTYAGWRDVLTDIRNSSPNGSSGVFFTSEYPAEWGLQYLDVPAAIKYDGNSTDFPALVGIATARRHIPLQNTIFHDYQKAGSYNDITFRQDLMNEYIDGFMPALLIDRSASPPFIVNISPSYTVDFVGYIGVLIHVLNTISMFGLAKSFTRPYLTDGDMLRPLSGSKYWNVIYNPYTGANSGDTINYSAWRSYDGDVGVVIGNMDAVDRVATIRLPGSEYLEPDVSYTLHTYSGGTTSFSYVTGGSISNGYTGSHALQSTSLMILEFKK